MPTVFLVQLTAEVLYQGGEQGFFIPQMFYLILVAFEIFRF